MSEELTGNIFTAPVDGASQMTGLNHQFITLLARWEDFRKKNTEASREDSQSFIDEATSIARALGQEKFEGLRDEAKAFRWSGELMDQVQYSVHRDGCPKDHPEDEECPKLSDHDDDEYSFALTHNSTTKDSEPSWTPYLSANRKDLPDNAFADPTMRKFPHHWESGGVLYLHKAGFNAAWAAAMGARSGQKATSEVIAHLKSHRGPLGLDEATMTDFALDPVNASEFLARIHQSEYAEPYAAVFGPMIEEGVTSGPIHIFINSMEQDRKFEQWILNDFPFDAAPRIKFFYGNYQDEMVDMPHVIIATKSIQPSTELTAFNESEFGSENAFRVQYTGSKAKMIDWILAKTPKDVKTILDPMSGGQGTTYGFRKAGKIVFAGDTLYSSYVLAKAVIENPGEKLSDDDISRLLAAGSVEGGFTDTIEQVYDTRQFMTKQLRQWIDGYLGSARQLEGHRKYIALSALTKAIIQASSHTGNLSWGPTSARLSNSNLKEFQRVLEMALRYINSRVVNEGSPVGKAFHSDAFKLTEQMQGKADMLYLDPPYITPETKRSLYRSYQVVSDVVEGKHRPYGDTWDHRTFEKYLRRLIELGAGYKYLLFSYRDNPMFPRSKLKSLMKEKFSSVVLYSLKVRYTSAPAGEQDKWREILILASNKGEVETADGQEMSFSGIGRGESQFADIPDDHNITTIDGMGLKKVLRDQSAYPLWIGNRVEGKPVNMIIRKGSVFVDDGYGEKPFEIPDSIQAYMNDMPDSVYSAILTEDNQIWILDVNSISGRRMDNHPFEQRNEVIWNPVPANRTGPIHAVEYARIYSPRDAIGPLVVASRGVDSRGAFIINSNGLHEFKNTEGFFAKVLKVAFTGFGSNLVLQTEKGYTKAQDVPGEFEAGQTVFALIDNGRLYREDATPWIKADSVTVFDAPEPPEGEAVFSDMIVAFESHLEDPYTNIENRMMPMGIHRAISAFEMSQDSRFTRPTMDSKFIVEAHINGNDVRIVISRKLDKDNTLVFSTEDEINLSKKPRNLEEATKLFQTEIRKVITNRLASGRFTLRMEPEATKGSGGSAYVVKFDEGLYRLGAVDKQHVEVFYSGQVLKGRYIERISGSEWTMIHSKGTPFSLTPTGNLPPTGHSGLSLELEERVPSEYQYWLEGNRDNRARMRDSLVKAISLGDVSLLDSTTKITLSEQTFKKPVKTAAGPKTSYRHLAICGGDHYFVFDDGRVALIGPTTNAIQELSGNIKPKSRFNATNFQSKVDQIIPDGECKIHAWFDDWRVFTIFDGEMAGTWTIRGDPQGLMELNQTGQSRLAAFSSQSIIEFSGKDFNIKEVAGSGDTPKYLEIDGPFFAWGFLQDGKGQKNFYPREEVKKAVLMPPPGQELVFMDLYHFQGERQKVGVIKEIWWNEDKEFDYTDPRGQKHKGKGMIYARYLITSKWGIKQILDGKERFVSAEPMFDMIHNKEHPGWHITLNIAFKGGAITAEPMIRSAIMENACSGGTCWELNA